MVVGGGPAGLAAATMLAAGGHTVGVLDHRPGGQHKPCGELLTPRSLVELRRLGIEPDDQFHRVDQLRVTFEGTSTSTGWPGHPEIGSFGAVVARPHLVGLLGRLAVSAGARVLDGHRATEPIVERGFVRGARVTQPDGVSTAMRSAFTIVADGADSRFGRALGTFRRQSWPYAVARRAIYRSPLHAAKEVEIVLDLTDRAGTPITGYGWVFPRGDGTVNVGVLMMSTSPSFRVVNPDHLLERFVDGHGQRWQLAAAPDQPPQGGRIPLGNSVGPAAGPTYLLAGDAAGAANPMTGAGIEYALETGTMAAEVIDEALTSGSATALQRYPKALADRYGGYYKVGRLSSRFLGQPTIMRTFAQTVARRRLAADGFVRITADEMRDVRGGLAETVYRVGRALSIVAPDA